MELQELKSKVSIFENFPRTINFGGLGFGFCFGRLCCLCAEFYNMNGKIT